MKHMTLLPAPTPSAHDLRRLHLLDGCYAWILFLSASMACVGAIDVNPLFIPFTTCALVVFAVVARRDLSLPERIFRYLFFPPYLLSLSASLSWPVPNHLAGSIAWCGLFVALSWADVDRRVFRAVERTQP